SIWPVYYFDLVTKTEQNQSPTHLCNSALHFLQDKISFSPNAAYVSSCFHTEAGEDSAPNAPDRRPGVVAVGFRCNSYARADRGNRLSDFLRRPRRNHRFLLDRRQGMGSRTSRIRSAVRSLHDVPAPAAAASPAAAGRAGPVVSAHY